MIIIRIWEGLGNQMFQYAYARSLSQAGYTVCLDLNKSYDDFFMKDKRQKKREVSLHNFNITLPYMNPKYKKKYKYIKQKTLIDKVVYRMAENGIWLYNFWDEINNKVIRGMCGNYYMKGWFQSPSYFNSIRKILLKEFTPKNKIIITPCLKEILKNKQTVSVHIRRTDYVSIHNVLDSKYYDNAIELMMKSFPESVFLIFSDDYAWVKQNMSFPENTYFIDEKEHLQDYEQLLVMSCCKNNIIANSTFSWWAAWLNRNPDKMVIMPKKWLKGQEKLIMKEWNVV